MCPSPPPPPLSVLLPELVLARPPLVPRLARLRRSLGRFFRPITVLEGGLCPRHAPGRGHTWTHGATRATGGSRRGVVGPRVADGPAPARRAHLSHLGLTAAQADGWNEGTTRARPARARPSPGQRAAWAHTSRTERSRSQLAAWLAGWCGGGCRSAWRGPPLVASPLVTVSAQSGVGGREGTEGGAAFPTDPLRRRPLLLLAVATLFGLSDALGLISSSSSLCFLPLLCSWFRQPSRCIRTPLPLLAVLLLLAGSSGHLRAR